MTRVVHKSATWDLWLEWYIILPSETYDSSGTKISQIRLMTRVVHKSAKCDLWLNWYLNLPHETYDSSGTYFCQMGLMTRVVQRSAQLDLSLKTAPQHGTRARPDCRRSAFALENRFRLWSFRRLALRRGAIADLAFLPGDAARARPARAEVWGGMTAPGVSRWRQLSTWVHRHWRIPIVGHHRFRAKPVATCYVNLIQFSQDGARCLQTSL